MSKPNSKPKTTLVIVESPSKCHKIEQYLGGGYKVIASFGHLRHIVDMESIDVANGFTVKYSIIQESSKLKQIEKIRAEICQSSDVIIATDDDREGEAIGWHICDLFSLSVADTKRIVFHEITESAIRHAISHPGRINMGMVRSQQTRQIIDMLVGYTLSPILWKCVSKTHDTSLSAGRCQTPALKLIYENYLLGQTGQGQGQGKVVYSTMGYFTDLNLCFELNRLFCNGDEAKEFLNKCVTHDFRLSVTEPKKTVRKNPEPLITSTLQQLASNELNLSPKDTMKYCQQLYEKGYITYMRTDSKKYSDEFLETATKYITDVYGEAYVNGTICNKDIKTKASPITTSPITASLNAPHEAIRPVDILTKTIDEDNDLKPKAIKLYELIWKRAVESCMSSAQYSVVTAKISGPLMSVSMSAVEPLITETSEAISVTEPLMSVSSKAEQTHFIYKTEKPIFLGWKIIEPNKTDEPNNKAYDYITALKQSVSMKPKKIESKFTMNELGGHYTEARLVQLLEEKGIGRPSTFASLVDKIQERKYVEKQNVVGKEVELVDYSLVQSVIETTLTKRSFGNEKNKLVIKPLGIIVIELLLNKFPSFFEYEYTKEMEDSLDSIANALTQGSATATSICEKCYTELKESTKDISELQKFGIQIDTNHELIIGKYGPVVKCTDSKTNKTTFLPVKKNLDMETIKRVPAFGNDELTLDDLLETTTANKDSIGKYKGKDLFLKKGKYGIYAQWGTETMSLKGELSNKSLEQIEYIEVLRFMDKDVLDPRKPVGLVRELNKNLSIRSGKYGDYIFYKRPRTKKAEFFKLNGFGGDYKKCEKDLILNWIQQTYEIC